MTRVWRSSLQFRVVISTMLLGLLVISLIGTYLFSAIAGGLEEDRRERSEQQALFLTAQAQIFVDAYQAREGDAQGQLSRDLLSNLLPAGNDQSLSIVFWRSRNNTSTVLDSRVATGPIRAGVVSEAMRDAVTADPARLQTQMARPTIGGNEVPAVIVGSQIDVPVAGPYDLFFITPMYQEQASLRLIANSLWVGGVALVLLTGAIAWLVARQAVTPIRRAATVAQRLEEGHLGERMPARGEDDIARLATTFNSMADSLQTQISQLEQLSRVQQRFVSDVSHELRTPLTTVRMAADLIYDSREEFTQPVNRSAELLQRELDRFEEMLSDLLEISRFDAGAAALDPEPVDLNDLVERVVRDARPLADPKGTEIILHKEPTSPEADVDPRRVQRILRNLVLNAVEHGEGRPVTVTVAGNEHAISVLVQDEGVGLRPGESALVFNRFWRADPSRARHIGGTGLGLAISLEDARLHNGWLQAWGAPGEGARFRLTLPRQQSVPIVTAPLPLAPPDEDDA